MENVLSIAQEHWIAVALLIIAGLLLMASGKRNRTQISVSTGMKTPLGNEPRSSSPGLSVTTRVVELSPDDEAYEPILREIERGNKIEAIKILRQAKEDLDLKTAKDIVERIERNRGRT